VDEKLTKYALGILLLVDVFAVVTGGFLETAYLESKFEDSERINIACIEEHGVRRLGESAVACALPDHYGNVALHNAEVVLIYVSVVILSIFLLEHALEAFATSLKSLSDWKNVFDIAIVMVSLGLEVGALSEQKITVSAGAIVLARLWRFVRIVHGTAEITEEIIEEKDEEKKDNPGDASDA